MQPERNNFVGANGQIATPPRPTPATPTVGEAVPRIDEHGLIHGPLSGERAVPAHGWARLPPGQFDVVPPVSPGTLVRVQAEDSSGDGPLAFRETEEDLVQLGIQKSIRHEHRQTIRRRRYQVHLDDCNERQLQRDLRADEETRAKKREWEAIAAAQFQPAASSSCSSSDSCSSSGED